MSTADQILTEVTEQIAARIGTMSIPDLCYWEGYFRCQLDIIKSIPSGQVMINTGQLDHVLTLIRAELADHGMGWGKRQRLH